MYVDIAWFYFRAAGDYDDVAERERDLYIFEFIKKRMFGGFLGLQSIDPLLLEIELLGI